MNNTTMVYYRLVLIIIISALILIGMTAHPVQLWDESRNAANAYNMYHDGYSLVTTFMDEGIDMWNTKPPLLIWLQASFMHIFGVNEWSLRLPSALAGMITCLTIAKWIRRESGSKTQAILGAFILATTAGFNGFHVVRTGDFDALLVMWTILASYHFFYFTKDNPLKHLYLFFIFTSLAVLTKSIAGLLFLPGLFIYTLYCRNYSQILRNKHLYYGIALFILIVGSYYTSRELLNPGYLKQIYENELGGRFSKALEDQNQPFYYYLAVFKMPYWVVFLPLSLYAFYRLSDKYKKIFSFSVIFISTFLITISLSQTKHAWYNAAIYPFTAVILTVSLYEFLSFLLLRQCRLKHRYTLQASLLLLCIVPGYETIRRNIYPSHNQNTANQLSLYIKDILKRDAPSSDLTKYYLVTNDYSPHILFYTFTDKQPNISIQITDINDISDNMEVLTNDNKVLTDLQNTFDTEIYVHKDGLLHFRTLNKSTNHQ